MSIRISRGIAVVAVCAAVAACSKGENKADSAAAADSIAKANAAATPAPAPAPAALTDANIVALLDVANVADSSAGSIAAKKATHADVKDFAKMMMRDHHSLRKAGEDLAKKENITPAAPAGDTSLVASQHWNDNLTSTPPGDAWDKAYIDHEVAYHQAVLATAQAGLAAAQDSALKALITKAAPNVQGHLTKAQSIQTKLNAAKP